MKSKEKEEMQAAPDAKPTRERDRYREPGKYFDGYAEEWDTMYAPSNAARAHDYVEREKHLLSWVDENLAASSRVLEFGCGAGHCALAMRKRGHQITALDVSAEMITAATNRFAGADLDADFVVGQIQDLVAQNEGEFDFIYALGVMDYIEDLTVTFDALSLLLSPGGRFILSFTNDQTPFRQVEMPLKRGLAKAIFTVTGKDKFKDVAEQSSRSHSLTEIDAIINANEELQRVSVDYFSYGIRMGKHWFPPYPFVRNADAFYQGAGAADWGRGFLLLGHKTQKEDLSIRPVSGSSIKALARLHQESFAESMGVSLGTLYVQKLLQWFAKTEGALFLSAQKDNELLGYVFGAFLEAQSTMNRDLLPAAGIGIVTNPRILMGKPFRQELARRALILLGHSPKQEVQSEVDAALIRPTFSLVGIGVAHSARGQGIAGRLMEEFEKRAFERGAKSIRLSVYGGNASARNAYEKKGYRRFVHPSNPDVLYYGKNFPGEAKNGS
jgi:2-polyprenyl-3-methyl-5-hydroxy-6-metoxy-1,4-benzoquinol methylase/ribosomal protein S18 acetylase RimI-like enzyme